MQNDKDTDNTNIRHRIAIIFAAVLAASGIGFGIWYALRMNEQERAKQENVTESSSSPAILGVVFFVVAAAIFIGAYLLFQFVRRKQVTSPDMTSNTQEKNAEQGQPQSQPRPTTQQSQPKQRKAPEVSVNKIRNNFIGLDKSMGEALKNPTSNENFSRKYIAKFLPDGGKRYNDAQAFLFDSPSTTETYLRSRNGATDQQKVDFKLMKKNNLANHELMLLEVKTKALKYLDTTIKNLDTNLRMVTKDIRKLEKLGGQTPGAAELKREMLYYVFAFYLLTTRFLVSTDRVALEAKQTQSEREAAQKRKNPPHKVNGYIGDVDDPSIDTAMIDKDGNVKFLDQITPLEQAIKQETDPVAKKLLELTQARRAAYNKAGIEFRENLVELLKLTKPFALQYEQIDSSETAEEPLEHQKNMWVVAKERLHLDTTYPFDARNAFNKLKKKHEKLTNDRNIDFEVEGAFETSPLEVR